MKDLKTNTTVGAAKDGMVEKMKYKSIEFKITHQATANGWSLSSHIVSVVARILFPGHQH